MRLFIRPDLRKRTRMEKAQQIKELESKRDQLLDQNMVNRAKSVQSQIDNLKKQIDKIERS